MATAKKPTQTKPKKKAPAKKPEPKVEAKAEKPKLPDSVKVRVNRGTVAYNGKHYVKGAKLQMNRVIAEKLAEPPIGANGQKTGLPPRVTIID